MLVNHTTVTAEHQYRGDKFRKDFTAAGGGRSRSVSTNGRGFASWATAIGSTIAMSFNRRTRRLNRGRGVLAGR